VVPENRLRVYDSLAVLHGIADAGSLLELRTAFGRIAGRPVGFPANNPPHLGGAIALPCAGVDGFVA
jgi:acetyl-CoA carboxylase carboxyltransferase component